MDISNLIKCLENGVCPEELLYKPNPETTEFDWDRVLYNIRYHDPAFYDSKFPKEVRQISAYDGQAEQGGFDLSRVTLQYIGQINHDLLALCDG
jgi:hypothetical protein